MTEIPGFCLNQGLSTPNDLLRTLKKYGHHASSEKEHFFSTQLHGLQMGIFGLWQKETGGKNIVMATAQRFSFLCVMYISHTMQV